MESRGEREKTIYEAEEKRKEEKRREDVLLCMENFTLLLFFIHHIRRLIEDLAKPPVPRHTVPRRQMQLSAECHFLIMALKHQRWSCEHVSCCGVAVMSD